MKDASLSRCQCQRVHLSKVNGRGSKAPEVGGIVGRRRKRVDEKVKGKEKTTKKPPSDHKKCQTSSPTTTPAMTIAPSQEQTRTTDTRPSCLRSQVDFG